MKIFSGSKDTSSYYNAAAVRSFLNRKRGVKDYYNAENIFKGNVEDPPSKTSSTHCHVTEIIKDSKTSLPPKTGRKAKKERVIKAIVNNDVKKRSIGIPWSNYVAFVGVTNLAETGGSKMPVARSKDNICHCSKSISVESKKSSKSCKSLKEKIRCRKQGSQDKCAITKLCRRRKNRSDTTVVRKWSQSLKIKNKQSKSSTSTQTIEIPVGEDPSGVQPEEVKSTGELDKSSKWCCKPFKTKSGSTGTSAQSISPKQSSDSKIRILPKKLKSMVSRSRISTQSIPPKQSSASKKRIVHKKVKGKKAHVEFTQSGSKSSLNVQRQHMSMFDLDNLAVSGQASLTSSSKSMSRAFGPTIFHDKSQLGMHVQPQHSGRSIREKLSTHVDIGKQTGKVEMVQTERLKEVNYEEGAAKTGTSDCMVNPISKIELLKGLIPLNEPELGSGVVQEEEKLSNGTIEEFLLENQPSDSQPLLVTWKNLSRPRRCQEGEGKTPTKPIVNYPALSTGKATYQIGNVFQCDSLEVIDPPQLQYDVNEQSRKALRNFNDLENVTKCNHLIISEYLKPRPKTTTNIHDGNEMTEDSLDGDKYSSRKVLKTNRQRFMLHTGIESNSSKETIPERQLVSAKSKKKVHYLAYPAFNDNNLGVGRMHRKLPSKLPILRTSKYRKSQLGGSTGDEDSFVTVSGDTSVTSNDDGYGKLKKGRQIRGIKVPDKKLPPEKGTSIFPDRLKVRGIMSKLPVLQEKVPNSTDSVDKVLNSFEEQKFEDVCPKKVLQKCNLEVVVHGGCTMSEPVENKQTSSTGIVEEFLKVESGNQTSTTCNKDVSTKVCSQTLVEVTQTEVAPVNDLIIEDLDEEKEIVASPTENDMALPSMTIYNKNFFNSNQCWEKSNHFLNNEDILNYNVRDSGVYANISFTDTAINSNPPGGMAYLDSDDETFRPIKRNCCKNLKANRRKKQCCISTSSVSSAPKELRIDFNRDNKATSPMPERSRIPIPVNKQPQINCTCRGTIKVDGICTVTTNHDVDIGSSTTIIHPILKPASNTSLSSLLGIRTEPSSELSHVNFADQGCITEPKECAEKDTSTDSPRSHKSVANQFNYKEKRSQSARKHKPTYKIRSKASFDAALLYQDCRLPKHKDRLSSLIAPFSRKKHNKMADEEKSRANAKKRYWKDFVSSFRINKSRSRHHDSCHCPNPKRTPKSQSEKTVYYGEVEPSAVFTNDPKAIEILYPANEINTTETCESVTETIAAVKHKGLCVNAQTRSIEMLTKPHQEVLKSLSEHLEHDNPVLDDNAFCDYVVNGDGSSEFFNYSKKLQQCYHHCTCGQILKIEVIKNSETSL